MKHSDWKTIVALFLLAGSAAASMINAQGQTPNLVLSNGEIVTVDDRFTIAEAVALRG